MRQQVSFVFLHRGRVHLCFSNGPSSGPWHGDENQTLMPCVVSKSIDLFPQIRQRKYFNLCWFIWESGPPAGRWDSTSSKNQYRDGNVKASDGNTTCSSDCIRIWDGGWIILALIHLDLSVRTTEERCILWIAGGSYNRAVVIKSTYLWAASVSSDHIGSLASDWLRSDGACLWLAGGDWALSSRGECEESCVGAGGRINRAWSHKGRPGHMTHGARARPSPIL